MYSKEKMIELLYRAHHNAIAAIAGDEGDYFDGLEVEADYLVAHGLSVYQWFSVEDCLPDRDDMIIAFYETMRGTTAEIQIHKAWAMSDTCTHWMPLPEPPKEWLKDV